MPPNDGEPADEADIWLRNITDKKHIRSDGKLRNNVFTGKAIAQGNEARSWAHELSGRLLSLTNDFEAEGQQYCKNRGRTFMGVMYASVQSLRAAVDGIRTDVYYTPIESVDQAHADFVTFGSTDESLFRIRDWLQETVMVALAPKCILASTLSKSPSLSQRSTEL
jgi:hypothetical protein